MTKQGAYRTARAFRHAVEVRLKQLASSSGVDIQRLRRQIAFDRLLFRIFADDEPRWLLKGGYAMELWLERARATRDIDLTLRALRASGQEESEAVSVRLREELQELVMVDAGDWFVFEILLATLDIEAAPYGGARFPVIARMDGRIFARFHIDIGVGGGILDPVEIRQGRDWLGFAGIAPPTLRVLSKEQQFAEKLHAYTMTDRPATNSRAKDLVDMALLIRDLQLDPERAKEAVELTFSRRDSHPLSSVLSEPPLNWARPFAELATETKLSLAMDDAFELVHAFYRSLFDPSP
jgi:hypothetical protein